MTRSSLTSKKRCDSPPDDDEPQIRNGDGDDGSQQEKGASVKILVPCKRVPNPEQKLKLAGGTRGTVDTLSRELRDALR